MKFESIIKPRLESEIDSIINPRFEYEILRVLLTGDWNMKF